VDAIELHYGDFGALVYVLRNLAVQPVLGQGYKLLTLHRTRKGAVQRCAVKP
jgi:hypothetical protein